MAPDLSTSGATDPGNAPSAAPPEHRDMSPYIRTYAKDMAMLTKQPLPTPSPAPAASVDLAPAPTSAPGLTHDGVTLPEVDASPVNRPDGASPKQFPAEVVSLTKEDSEGIFAKRASGSGATPAPDTVSRTELPALPHLPRPAPAPERAATPPPVDREAVLARLRKKLATRQQETPLPASAPPPIPKPAPPKPIPTPIPEAFVRPAPTVEPNWQPPPPPRPVAVPPLPPSPTPVPEQGSDPLHTYTSDFADRIDREQASTFSVLAAQQDAGQGKTRAASPKRSLLPITLAVLLIVLGTGGMYAAYRFMNPVIPGQESLGVPSLIFADEKTELEGPNYRQALADATNEPLVEGNILVTYVTGASPASLEEGSTPQPGGVLIRALDLGAPDILLRNVDLSSTVGIINAGTETRPFFILRVSSYERTFAGMLGWERRMLDDLAPLYPPYADLAPLAPMSPPVDATATNTVPLPPPLPLAPASAEFVDIVVANHDARALKDRFGRTLVLYGYSDKQTLIIARDEAAFTALVARLAATAGN